MDAVAAELLDRDLEGGARPERATEEQEAHRAALQLAARRSGLEALGQVEDVPDAAAAEVGEADQTLAGGRGIVGAGTVHGQDRSRRGGRLGTAWKAPSAPLGPPRGGGGPQNPDRPLDLPRARRYNVAPNRTRSSTG